MSKEQFGTQTPVYNRLAYDSRQQLSEIRVSTSANDTANDETSWNRGKIINWYGGSVRATTAQDWRAPQQPVARALPDRRRGSVDSTHRFRSRLSRCLPR